MVSLTAWSLLAFTGAMYVVAWSASRRVDDAVDFLVAGRRLSFPLASATLLATWFGAGTMMTAADEVRRGGLERIALEPVGSGVCLILAGIFFAAPLWRMQLLTLADFYRRRFGRRAEVIAGWILVPSYFGWIAVQYISLAAVLNIVLGLDVSTGILIVAAVATGYTLMGGMWSVTLTDAVQVALMLAGLVVLGAVVLSSVGGFGALIERTPPGMLAPLPDESWSALVEWFGVFCIAALGNIPAQDLMQRIFAARSAGVAKAACWTAGIAYLVFGMIPVGLGLASNLLLPGEISAGVIPALTQSLLSPALAAILIVTLAAAILSTTDSALLSPASVLAVNLFPGNGRGLSTIARTRIAVLVVSVASVVLAFAGESAYSLLEDAYSLPLVGMLVPLVGGLVLRNPGERAALASMIAGALSFLVHWVFGWDSFLAPFWPEAWLQLPMPLACAVVGLAAFALFRRRTRSGVGR